ncbi:putative membrane protein [Marinitoga hydrogenitolerans DSM 16785]|uniref:Membrane protein n=1 Tax=Marinitoga hydrogenitolerans (strain DSM 16785 / JCM 12826 / AT1271) TaxID=1122195 RepID=A0A1M4YIL4_MARH1|nr:SHOCT domain-containing protein [Marinitoga hydrogenitolerans]SHF05463.1 putative membrane protein [Marinitoga hydrogenitolerans DSM 16785]
MPCWGWSGFFYGYGGIIGSLIGFGFMILLVVIVYFLFKNLFKPNNLKKSNVKTSNEDLLRILNEKFVNGEITEEEYMRKKKLIE